MHNKDIRDILAKSGIKHWELAEKYGVSASWLSVKLRKELTTEEKLKVFDCIQQIIDERSKTNA